MHDRPCLLRSWPLQFRMSWGGFSFAAAPPRVHVASMPKRKRNENLTQLKADLAQRLQSLRFAQGRIRELRASQVEEAEIRKLMLTLGFGSITPAQFLKARTVQQVMKLMERLSQPGLN
jgi:hypothetical protein